MTDNVATKPQPVLSACLHSRRASQAEPTARIGAVQPRRTVPRDGQTIRRALLEIGAINPWTDFVLGPSYGRALPPLPEDRRRA